MHSPLLKKRTFFSLSWRWTWLTLLSTQLLLLRVLPCSGSQFYPRKGRETAAATRQLRGLGAGIPGTLRALPKRRSGVPSGLSWEAEQATWWIKEEKEGDSCPILGSGFQAWVRGLDISTSPGNLKETHSLWLQPKPTSQKQEGGVERHRLN